MLVKNVNVTFIIVKELLQIALFIDIKQIFSLKHIITFNF
tara:strand:- start:6277 stop:6396 length:120 start_codon:yes stop_codon:yes gene_type:complete